MGSILLFFSLLVSVVIVLFRVTDKQDTSIQNLKFLGRSLYIHDKCFKNVILFFILPDIVLYFYVPTLTGGF